TPIRLRRAMVSEQDQWQLGGQEAADRRAADVRVEAALALAEVGVLIAEFEGEPAPFRCRTQAPVAARTAVLDPGVAGQALQGDGLVQGIVGADLGAPDLPGGI